MAARLLQHVGLEEGEGLSDARDFRSRVDTGLPGGEPTLSNYTRQEDR